ncbi:hypothetical protein OAE77_00785, partial [bacterium]|nr:hypothetical protein [bacterium]
AVGHLIERNHRDSFDRSSIRRLHASTTKTPTACRKTREDASQRADVGLRKTSWYLAHLPVRNREEASLMKNARKQKLIHGALELRRLPTLSE